MRRRSESSNSWPIVPALFLSQQIKRRPYMDSHRPSFTVFVDWDPPMMWQRKLAFGQKWLQHTHLWGNTFGSGLVMCKPEEGWQLFGWPGTSSKSPKMSKSLIGSICGQWHRILTRTTPNKSAFVDLQLQCCTWHRLTWFNLCQSTADHVHVKSLLRHQTVRDKKREREERRL